MKARFYYLLLLGTLFLFSGNASAATAGHASFHGCSFQRSQQEQALASEDAEAPDAFFSCALDDDEVSADLDLDDDDDVSFSARKRFSFESNSFFYTTQDALQHFRDQFPGECFALHGCKDHSSYFIFLRVFRI